MFPPSAAAIAAPQLVRNVAFVPNPDQDSPPLRLAAQILDLLFGERGALRQPQTPLRKRRSELLPLAFEGGIAAEIAELVRIGLQIEQHRAEADRMHIFPAPVRNHEQARVARLDAEFASCGFERIIVFAEYGLAPGRGRFAVKESAQRAALQPV